MSQKLKKWIKYVKMPFILLINCHRIRKWWATSKKDFKFRKCCILQWKRSNSNAKPHSCAKFKPPPIWYLLQSKSVWEKEKLYSHLRPTFISIVCQRYHHHLKMISKWKQLKSFFFRIANHTADLISKFYSASSVAWSKKAKIVLPPIE